MNFKRVYQTLDFWQNRTLQMKITYYIEHTIVITVVKIQVCVCNYM